MNNRSGHTVPQVLGTRAQGSDHIDIVPDAVCVCAVLDH